MRLPWRVRKLVVTSPTEVELETTGRDPDLAAFLADDPGVLDTLFQIAYRIVGSPSDAENAVKEVLFRVWRDGTARIRGTLNAYLIGAVRNEAFTIQRELRHRTPVDPTMFASLSDTASSPEDEVVRQAVQDAVRQAVVKLPPRQRQVVLGLQEGSTMNELAAQLGVSRERMGQINREARVRLCRLLRSWGDVE